MNSVVSGINIVVLLLLLVVLIFGFVFYFYIGLIVVIVGTVGLNLFRYVANVNLISINTSDPITRDVGSRNKLVLYE